MSNPRYGWWGYVKWMIRGYKNGALLTKAESEAVRDAVTETGQLVDGAERLKLVHGSLEAHTHHSGGGNGYFRLRPHRAGVAQAIYSPCGAKKGSFVKKSASQSQI